MNSKGVSKDDGICMMVEHPVPGMGGRHREIHKELIKQDPNLAPRDALAQSINRAKEVYKKDGVYNEEVRKGLQGVIDKNKQSFPALFKKK